MVHEEMYQEEEVCGTRQNSYDNDDDGNNNKFMARLSITRVKNAVELDQKWR